MSAQLNEHGELMKALYDRTGPIPDGKAQGGAIQWLLKNGYTVEQIIGCLDAQWKERKANGGWRSKVSYLTVKSEIGTWIGRRAKPEPPSEAESESDDIFPRKAAIELVRALETEPKKYEWQISKLKEQYQIR